MRKLEVIVGHNPGGGYKWQVGCAAPYFASGFAPTLPMAEEDAKEAKSKLARQNR